MKSRERHDLAKNELADIITQTLDRIKPFIGYALVAALVVAAILAWRGWQERQTTGAREQVASAFYEAMYVQGETPLLTPDRRIDSLESFLAKHEGSDVAPLARSMLGGEYYNRALSALSDETANPATRADLDKARELYGRVARGSDLLARWADYGLACVEATTADLDKAEAIAERGTAQAENNAEKLAAAEARLAKADQATTQAEDRLADLARRWPDTPLEIAANQRLEALRSGRPLSFDPEPPKPPEPPKSEEQPKTEETPAPKPEAAPGEATPEPPPADLNQ